LQESLRDLQLLVDQFNDSDEPDQRDDILADIIRHESPQALDFLRLVAAQPGEDPYTRADAEVGLYLRSRGTEAKDALLIYLQNLEPAYPFCIAAEALAEVPAPEAASLLRAALSQPLRTPALLAAFTALQKLEPEATAQHFADTLLALSDPSQLDFERTDLMLKSLAGCGLQAFVPKLREIGAHYLALGKKFPADRDDLEELGEQALEAAAQLALEDA
jgi:hypothetical protein